MPARLKSKLVLSHVGLTLLAFVLTMVLAVVPVRRAQIQDLEDQLENGAEALARQLALITQFSETSVSEQVTADPAATAIALRLAADWANARVLLVREDGTVVVDSTTSGESLAGERLPQVADAIRRINALIPKSLLENAENTGRLAQQARSMRIEPIDGNISIVATTLLTATQEEDPLYLVAMAPKPRFPAADRFVRPMLVAAGISLVISFGIAWLLARSISKPVTTLTKTATEIAGGKLERRAAPTSGEFGVLVDAFNTMLDRLESVNASQRRLLANIAHELRTPLTSIQGYAQAMRDGLFTSGDAYREAVDVIAEESQRMEQLVNQVLQLSRLESGERPLRLETVEIQALLEDVVRRFLPSAMAAEISLTANAPGDLLLRADRELLLQALGNLVSNAMRHTPAGGHIRLSASIEPDSQSQRSMTLTVADDGEGIPADQLEKIFERFQRGDDATNGESMGFGLGLAIVREVAVRHRGTVTVESSPGQGAAFTLRLPLSSLPEPS